MDEKKFSSSHDQGMKFKKIENRTLFFSDPERWDQGNIINIGPVEEFDQWRGKIILTSVEEVVKDVLSGTNDVGEKFIAIFKSYIPDSSYLVGPNYKDELMAEIESLQYDEQYDSERAILKLVDEFSDFVFSRTVNLEESVEFKLLLEEIKQKNPTVAEDMDVMFWQKIAEKMLNVAKHEIRSYKNFTEYYGRYKDAFIILTEDEGICYKDQVASFRIHNGKKIITFRRDAYNILKSEESVKKEQGLVDHVLEHEYHEVQHVADPVNVPSPHTQLRDPNYLKVLKILRKRNYFHDLVT